MQKCTHLLWEMQHNAKRGQVKAKCIILIYYIIYILILVLQIKKSRGKPKHYKYFIKKSIYDKNIKYSWKRDT